MTHLKNTAPSFPHSNPNEQLENDHVRDRTRFKNIEWTPYESVHKKYLNLGE